VWHQDLGLALARALERESPRGTALPLAGPDVTTTAEVLKLLQKLTGTHAPRLPIPETLARLGVGAAEALGIDVRVTGDQITMLVEGNVIGPDEVNALDTFGVTPHTLAEGLGRLVDEMPERLPQEGTGALEMQRYWADIHGGMPADALFEFFRREFGTLQPEALLEVGPEPGAQTELEEGNTITMALPLRGNIQVRVAEIRDRAITCVTLRGHPLSGAIRFLVEEPADGVARMEVRSYTRPSGLVDLVGMRTLGKVAQKATWRSVVERVVERSGGTAPEGVQEETRTLEGSDAEGLEQWVEEIVMRQKRKSAPKSPSS
jgi:NADH dehydrogenase